MTILRKLDMLPALRTNLRSISSKNKSLQDILKSCKYGFEVVSVEPWTQGIHNTKITIEVDQGSAYPKDQRFIKRVHFYNRLNLAVILQAVPVIIGDTTTEVIENLNLLGYDFTTDDIELVDDEVLALPTSLGYYNGGAGDCSPTEITWDNSSLSAFDLWDSEGHEAELGESAAICLGFTLTVNGVTNSGRIFHIFDTYDDYMPEVIHNLLFKIHPLWGSVLEHFDVFNFLNNDSYMGRISGYNVGENGALPSPATLVISHNDFIVSEDPYPDAATIDFLTVFGSPEPITLHSCGIVSPAIIPPQINEGPTIVEPLE